VAILRDAALQQRTIEAVGPEKVMGPGFNPSQPNAMARAVASMAADLNINSTLLSNSISITYRNRDAEVSADVVNDLVKFYLEARTAVYNRSQTGSMIQQRDAYAERLRSADQALSQFGELHHITNLDDQVSLLLKQQSDMVQQITDVNQRVDASVGRAAQLREQLVRTPQTVAQFTDTSRSIAGDARSSDLARLQAQRRESAERYTDNSPQIQDLDRQIAQTQTQLRGGGNRDVSATRSGRNSLYDDLTDTLAKQETEQRGLEASKAALQNAQAALQTRLTELNDAGQQYRTLKRDRDVLEDTYKTFSRNAEEARLSDELNRSRFGNVRLVQAATPPPLPTSRRSLFAAAGVLLGLVCAVASAILLSVLRQVVIDRPEAERKLGLPVLMTVNYSAGHRARQGMPQGGRGYQ